MTALKHIPACAFAGAAVARVLQRLWCHNLKNIFSPVLSNMVSSLHFSPPYRHT